MIDVTRESLTAELQHVAEMAGVLIRTVPSPPWPCAHRV